MTTTKMEWVVQWRASGARRWYNDRRFSNVKAATLNLSRQRKVYYKSKFRLIERKTTIEERVIE